MVTGALLASAPLSSWSDDAARHEPADEADNVSEAQVSAANTGEFEGLVIERTLGGDTSETIIVARGAAVRLILHAPVGTELHLHGYDLSGTAAGGAPIIMTFDADHLGRFPIEAHGVADLLGRTDRALAYVEVRSE